MYNVSLENLDKEIQKAVEYLAQFIDWGELLDDTRAPEVYWTLPPNEATSSHELSLGVVPIETEVYFKLRDMESGIDWSSIQVLLTVSGTDSRTSILTWDITDEVVKSGTVYDTQLYWRPPKRVYDYY